MDLYLFVSISSNFSLWVCNREDVGIVLIFRCRFLGDEWLFRSRGFGFEGGMRILGVLVNLV